MRNIFLKLKVIQERKPSKYMKEYRINPFNPLSYITIIICTIIVFIIGGVKECRDDIFSKNFMKWH